MPRKRNLLGQFTVNDNYNALYIEIPKHLNYLNIFLVLLAISPWIFVLLYRVDIKSAFKGLIEKNFVINQGESKKQIVFFYI